ARARPRTTPPKRGNAVLGWGRRFAHFNHYIAGGLATTRCTKTGGSRASGTNTVDTIQIQRAKARLLENVVAELGLKLKGGIERIGACSTCGGTDRFAINIKKQLWNCRGCRV